MNAVNFRGAKLNIPARLSNYRDAREYAAAEIYFHFWSTFNLTAYDPAVWTKFQEFTSTLSPNPLLDLDLDKMTIHDLELLMLKVVEKHEKEFMAWLEHQFELVAQT